MKSFYEDILERSVAVPDFLKTAMRRAVVIHVQNVADYYFWGTSQEVWNIEKDFPNVAPPWPEFWMEWRMPAKVNSEGRILTPATIGVQFGVLLRAIAASGDGWRYEITLITRASANTDIGGLTWLCVEVSSEGTAVWPEHARIGQNVLIGGRPAIYAEPEVKDFVGEFTTVSLHVPFLAVSFCHCKNTIIREESVNRAERRRADRDGRTPLRFYTLDIGPVREILKHDGSAETTGLQRALHICRGHFKDYRERGLFGKIKGLFWWDMHIRGEAEKGSVGKDYRIEPSNEV